MDDFVLDVAVAGGGRHVGLPQTAADADAGIWDMLGQGVRA